MHLNVQCSCNICIVITNEIFSTLEEISLVNLICEKLYKLIMS